MNPFFSIITVVRNGEGTISRTIESVLGQTYKNIEYIIIDGNSEDKTLHCVDSYRGAFDENGISLHVISENDNGIYDAMNKGLKRSSGLWNYRTSGNYVRCGGCRSGKCREG